MSVTEVALEGGRRAVVTAVGTGTPLLCIPGGPGFAAAGHLGTLGGLDLVRTLLLVDLRGSGTSDPPATPSWSVDEYVADVAAVQTALALPVVDLFGHSHGGFVAATYATRFPNEVRRLVLDGTPLRPRDLTPPAQGMPGYFAAWDKVAQRYVQALEPTLFEPALDWFAENEWDAIDLSTVLPDVKAPTLVLTGDADWACGAAAAAAASTLLPRGEVAVIADAGHFAWLEQPERYRNAVSTFLDG